MTELKKIIAFILFDAHSRLKPVLREIEVPVLREIDGPLLQVKGTDQ